METLAKSNLITSGSSYEESRALMDSLHRTSLFARYERAFSASSSLPLSLRPLASFQMPAREHKKENPFCALMAQNRKGCVACLQAQTELEELSPNQSRSTTCYAGLQETMIPIRIGNKVTGYLQTGQVALRPLRLDDFDRLHSELIIRGIEVPARDARRSYLQSKQMSRESYQGFVRLLELFAEHLGSAANVLMMNARARRDTGTASKAIRYIEQNFQSRITLKALSKAAGSSERHLCKLFKMETGLTFVDYLTRYRIEFAKKALRESNRRISEIAFESGFESIAQFNKAFRRVCAASPSEYRKNAMS